MGYNSIISIMSKGVASAPVNTVAPVISGTNVVGNTLTTTNGTWTGSSPITYTYQWKRGASNIVGATSSTYVLVQADATNSITCVVTATNSVGSANATSNALTIFDSNANDFIVAESGAGVTLTSTQQNAINQLVFDLKAANIYSKFKALYPIIGGTATAHKFNLINPADTNAAFRLVFSGGWTHSATGALPNGTNAYSDTFFQSSNFTSYPNCSFGYYSRTNVNNSKREIGANQLDIYSNLSGLAYVRTASGSFTTFTVTNSLGFVMGSRLNTTTQKAYKNGVLTGTTTQTGGTSFAFNIYIGAYNSSGTASDFSNRECAFAYLSDGLTDLESQLFYQITEKYQVALGRNVNATQSFYYNAAYNNETNAFLFSTQITDATIQTATNTLVSDLKTANIWTKMKAIYPIVGGTATTHKFNLVNSQDSDAAFRLSFVGGWTHSSNGALPNGTNAYADTFLSPSTQLTLNSQSLSYYSRTSAMQSGTNYIMGSYNGGGTTVFALSLSMSGTTATSYINSTSAGSFSSVAHSNQSGYWIANKLNATANTHRLWKNNTAVGSTPTVTAGSLLFNTIWLGALPNPPLAGYFGNAQCAFASIGDGLTDAEALSFYNAVQTFNTTLGRQV